MSGSPDNLIRTALVEYEKQRAKIPFITISRNQEQDSIELTINFSPETTGFNTLKFQITNTHDIVQTRNEVLELVNWVMNEVFQVDIGKAEKLDKKIENTEGGFQSLWNSDEGIENMNETISAIFRKIDHSQGITTPHIMCHDFNSFAVGVLNVIALINPSASSITKVNEIVNMATKYNLYKSIAGIASTARPPRNTSPQTPHEHFVVPTLKLMLWLKDLVENIDKYIPVPEEA